MLNLYLHDINCDQEMRERFRAFFLKAREMMRHSYYRDILALLSPKLRAQVLTSSSASAHRRRRRRGSPPSALVPSL